MVCCPVGSAVLSRPLNRLETGPYRAKRISVRSIVLNGPLTNNHCLKY